MTALSKWYLQPFFTLIVVAGSPQIHDHDLDLGAPLAIMTAFHPTVTICDLLCQVLTSGEASRKSHMVIMYDSILNSHQYWNTLLRI